MKSDDLVLLQIIDYGLAKLDDHYSWASGWVETALAEQRLARYSLSRATLSSTGDAEEVVTPPRGSQQDKRKNQALKLKYIWNQPTGFEW